jgi:acyl carrier protein
MGDHLLLSWPGGVSGGLAARLVGAGLGAAVDEAGLEARLAQGGWRGLVDLRALDPGPAGESPAGAAERLTDTAVRLAQVLAGRLPVRLVTCGAVAAGPGEPVLAPAPAALWGLAAAAALEEPASGWRRIDLDPVAEEGAWAAALAAELARADGEDRVAWRGGGRRVARLTRRAVPAGAGGFATRGTWLVTGGLGGLGRALGPWLRAHGAERVVLAGRRLREAPAGCEARALDVTAAGAVEALLRELAGGGPPLVGIVHAAGVLDDAPLAGLDRARLARVLGPKAAGAWHLHEASRALAPGLERFVLFGSVAGVLGNAGQANHAAANGFLDALAWQRRGQGLPASVVDWGAWDRIGAAAEAAGRLDLRWTMLMPPEEALAALERLLVTDAPQTAVVPVDWAAFAYATTAPLAGFTAELLSEDPAQGDGRRAAAGWDGPAEAADGNGEAIERSLVKELARILGAGSEAIELDRPLHDYGFDSLMAITLRNRIRANFGVEPDLAFLLAGTTVAGLAERIRTLQGAPRTDLPADEAGIARMVAGLSEAEVDELLAKLLADRPATSGSTSVADRPLLSF